MADTCDLEASPVECRICQSSTANDLIQSPCLCKGSLGRVHISCLEDWLSASSKNSCELCSHQFDLVRVRQYNFFESIWIWISQNRKIAYTGFVLILATCVIISTLFFMWIRWISNVAEIIREEREAKERAKSDPHSDPEVRLERKGGTSIWIEGMAFFFYLVLMIALRIAFEETYALVKAQYGEWRRWWNQTWKVHLVLDSQHGKMTGKHHDGVELSKTVISETSKSSLASCHDDELHVQCEALSEVYRPAVWNI